MLVVSSEPGAFPEYLAGAGHEVYECYSTDLAERAAEERSPDAVLFFEGVAEMAPVSRREALRRLVKRARVVLLAEKTSELVPYAAALGVRDFVFLPASPAQVLHRLENPATAEEAAETVAGARAPAAPEAAGEFLPGGGREKPREPKKGREHPGEFPRLKKEPRGVVVIGGLAPGVVCALAEEWARRHLACCLVDASPRAELTRFLGADASECSWQSPRQPLSMLTRTGDGLILFWPTRGGGLTRGFWDVVSVHSAGGVVVVYAGEGEAGEEVYRTGASFVVCSPGHARLLPRGTRAVAVLGGERDRRSLRQAAAECGLPCASLGHAPGETLSRLVEAALAGKALPGAVGPPAAARAGRLALWTCLLVALAAAAAWLLGRAPLAGRAGGFLGTAVGAARGAASALGRLEFPTGGGMLGL